jgi:excisionase family DNA binding protein
MRPPIGRPTQQVPLPLPVGGSAEELLRSLDHHLGQIYAALNGIRARLEGTTKSHFTVEEVAKLTGRSAYTVRRWVSEHRLNATRVSGTGPKGRLLIPRDQLEKLIGSGLGGDIPAAGACAAGTDR